MENPLMNLKILLPFQVFREVANVGSIVLETSKGSYGLLPQRLDCVAALVPGILTYSTEPGGVHYLAVDAGVLVKAGLQVWLSVRNAIGGADLGKLSETVKKEFMDLGESEKKERSVMTKLESGLLYRLNKFRKA
jgi:F-type H+-transporting ATPase subunit epsilon